MREMYKKSKFVGVKKCIYIYMNSKGKAVPTGHVGPEGSMRVKAPSFHGIGTVMVVGCQPCAPAAFTPQEHS